jgi:hypothetical protein
MQIDAWAAGRRSMYDCERASAGGTARPSHRSTSVAGPNNCTTDGATGANECTKPSPYPSGKLITSIDCSCARRFSASHTAYERRSQGSGSTRPSFHRRSDGGASMTTSTGPSR